MNHIFKFFSSLRLTIFLLTSGLILIFFGTLDQVNYGIYFTQQKYFEHVFVLWEYPAQWLWGEQLSWLSVPLPGGYLIGPMLILNLACAHFRYFRPSWKKTGIVLIHAGIVLFLLGQLWTQVQQKEYFMWLAEGESKNYVESFHHNEFVIIDKSGEERDRVFSWDAPALKKEGTVLSHPDLPFQIESLWYAKNAAIFPRNSAQGQFPPMPFDRGIGKDQEFVALAMKPTYAENERNVGTAMVRLRDKNDEALGTWLVSNIFRQKFPTRQFFPVQSFDHDGKTYQLAIRYKRRYLPADIELLDFNHDRYPGTNIPHNFSSEVRIHPFEENKSPRDTLIYMNHPLRYAGLTFYQASFADNDTRSMFQVVRNPARWMPYIACAVVTLGLIVQFTISLLRHTSRQSGSKA